MFRWLMRLFGPTAAGAKPSHNPDASSIPPGTYVIGKTKDLVKHKASVARNDPRRSLFNYHELREEEEKQWRLDNVRHVLETENPGRADKLIMRIHKLNKAYSVQEMRDLVEINPSAADSIVADLCRQYRQGSGRERDFIRSGIDDKTAWTLLTYSKRAAVLAVRKSEPDLIRDSLIAHAIEDIAAGDVRDNLVALGLIYHCSRAVDLHSVEVFDEVAAIAGPPIAQLLQGFVRRPDLDNILTAMGWREVTTKDGVGYRWAT